MSTDLATYVSQLENRVRLLESGQSAFNAPGWKDITDLDRKLKESQAEIVSLKVQLSEQRIGRSEIKNMIDEANRIQSTQIGNTIGHITQMPDWRAMVTEDLAVELRSEVQASLGSASSAATAAKAVARATVDNAVQTLRSRSHFWARG